MPVSEETLRLIDRWQRGFPLVPRPYAAVGATSGLDEADVIARLAELRDAGILSRVGAALRPNTAGASTLAALCVPPEDLDAVAALVSAERTVNHNYQREHRFNLWFVVTADTRASVARTLVRIGEAACAPVLDLPLVRAYHIDLGFPLLGGAGPRDGALPEATHVTARPLDAGDMALLEALEHGLSLQPSPYAALARDAGLSEEAVLARLHELIEGKVIARFGLIVKHRALGYTANAMAVWDVSDDEVDRIGDILARRPEATLCYRRRRQGPDWPYNLFCMVHGRERSLVTAQVAELARAAGIQDRPGEVLFSTRCFKQRGATLAAA